MVAHTSGSKKALFFGCAVALCLASDATGFVAAIKPATIIHTRSLRKEGALARLPTSLSWNGLLLFMARILLSPAYASGIRWSPFSKMASSSAEADVFNET
jgi:hypothetical protein